MKIIDCIKRILAKKIYNESKRKSEKTLNNILFKDGETPLYFSRTRYKNLLDTFNIQPRLSSSHEQYRLERNNLSTAGDIKNCFASIKSEFSFTKESGTKDCDYYDGSSEISTIKDNLEKIKKDGTKITEVYKKGFFYTHFPVFHGHIAEFKIENIIKSVYIWYGLYRNIELYLCGSANNVFQIDKQKYPEALWDPSSIEGPKNIFDKLVSDIVEKNNDLSETITDGENIFKILKSNIKDTVMNRHGAESFLQWQDMIAYCTAFEEQDGIKRIFGVPILVIPSSVYGYGWYNLSHKNRYQDCNTHRYHPNDKTIYYEFDNKKFTGRYLKQSHDDASLPILSKNPIGEIDANSAYRLHFYERKRCKKIPDNNDVKQCDDIIGLCIEKYLIKK